MSRFSNDQNRVSLFYESGVYGNQSGNTAVWIGKVQSNTITENIAVNETRILGTASRGIDQFDTTTKDFEGTLSYYPQHFQMLGFALGSISFTSGASNTHGYTAINSDVRQNAFTSGTLNPFISFQIEDGKVTQAGSFTRTAQGCVIDTFSLSASQGEIVECEVGYKAQNVIDTVNAPSALTAIGSKVYLWKDVALHIPSGTAIESCKELTLEIANNFETPHYLNGSDVIGTPIALNRDITVSATADLQTENLSLYNNQWKSGVGFTALIDLNGNPGALAAIGSMRALITLSGCRFTSFDIPSELEGTNEVSFEFKAGSITVTEYNQYPKRVAW